MTLYGEIADMARDLLKPDTAGGLGQGAVTIVRMVPGEPDPDTPWEPTEPTRLAEDVDQIGKVKAEYTTGGTIIVTDYAYMTVPTATFATRPGDFVERDGVTVGTVVHVAPYPPHGTAVYQNIFVNR